MQGGSLELGEDSVLNAAEITVNGGSIVLNARAQLFAANNFSMSGGTLEVKGDTKPFDQLFMILGNTVKVTGTAVVDIGHTALAANSVFELNGGTIKMNGAKNTMLTGGIRSGAISLRNGTVEVLTSGVLSAKTMDFAGADISISPSAQLTLGWSSSNESNEVNHTAGTVTMEKGSAQYDVGVMCIESRTIYHLNGGKLVNSGALQISGTLDISKAGDGFENAGLISIVDALSSVQPARFILNDKQLASLLQAPDTQIFVGKNGVLDLGESATLDAALIATSEAGKDRFIQISTGGKMEVVALTLNGEGMSLNEEGMIRANQLTLNATGDFSVTSGKILLRGESGSSLEGNLLLNADATANAELRLGEYNAETAVLAEGGKLAADINVQTGTVAVVAGTWTQEAGRAFVVGNGGVLNIGGVTDADYLSSGSMPAKLVITGSLQSSAAGNGSTGINVLENGTLEAEKGILLNGTNRTNGLESLFVDVGGTLLVTGLGTVTKAELEDMKANLMSGGGTFDFFDATVDDAPQVNPDGTIDYNDVLTGGFTSLAYQNATVVNVDGPLSGGFAAVQLADGGRLEVEGNTTLTLNGSKGGVIIANKDGTEGDSPLRARSIWAKAERPAAEPSAMSF